MRTLAVISGIGLVILWLAGLSSPNAAVWLTWLNGVGALACFVVGGAKGTRKGLVNGAVGTSIGLFALWIIGLASNGAQFQNWWTFVFGCVMAFAAITGSAENRRMLGAHPESTEDVTISGIRDRFRKSA
jgi:hypothetical protein